MSNSTTPSSVFAAVAMDADRLSRHASGAAGCASLAVTHQEGGDPVVGIAYTVNASAEEEHGVCVLVRGIAGAGEGPRMDPGAAAHVVAFEDVCGLVVSSRPITDPIRHWGDPLPGGSVDYVLDFSSRLDFARSFDLDQTVPRLREMARELGIPTSGRRKHQLASAIRCHPEVHMVADRQERWPAWFGDGQTLVLRADDGPVRAALERLIASLMAGELAVSEARAPLGAALVLYDARDESPQTREQRQARRDWHRERMAELAPVAARLQAGGHRWFFLGRPTETTRDGVTAVRYWLNGTGMGPDGRWGPQPFGWYTLEELAEEKFIADARARAAS